MLSKIISEFLTPYLIVNMGTAFTENVFYSSLKVPVQIRI